MIALFAEAPALPLHAAGKYVAGAYIVFVLVIVIYVAIMGIRLARGQREIADLHRLLAERERTGAGPAGPAPVQELTEDPKEPAAYE